MKYFSLLVLAALSGLTIGCDPFSDDNLPKATIVMKNFPANQDLQLGTAYNLKAEVNTAERVDSLLLTFASVDNGDRYSLPLSVPAELVDVDEDPVKAVVESPFTLDELPVSGVSTYRVSLEAFVGHERYSAGWFEVKVVQ